MFTSICHSILTLVTQLYTTVLVVMTQQLAAHLAMTSRQDLTFVHDMSCAWAGVGSAVISLSQQRKAAVAFWMTLCIVIYFGCISILHISSSTLMEFQTFNSTVATLVPSTLAWPDSSISLQDLNWANIIPLISVVNNLPDLSTKGLFSNTVYDIPSVTPESLYATVNATAIDAQCGLLSNLSYAGSSINFILPSMGSQQMHINAMCKSFVKQMLINSYQFSGNNTIMFVNPDNFEVQHDSKNNIHLE